MNTKIIPINKASYLQLQIVAKHNGFDELSSDHMEAIECKSISKKQLALLLATFKQYDVVAVDIRDRDFTSSLSAMQYEFMKKTGLNVTIDDTVVITSTAFRIPKSKKRNIQLDETKPEVLVKVRARVKTLLVSNKPKDWAVLVEAIGGKHAGKYFAIPSSKISGAKIALA